MRLRIYGKPFGISNVSSIGGNQVMRETTMDADAAQAALDDYHANGGISLEQLKAEMWNPLLGRPTLDICPFCGSPEYGSVQEHGSYKTTCCRQYETTCCDGAGG